MANGKQENGIVNGAEADSRAVAADIPLIVEEESIPVMQQILDNPFLLLFLGVAIPTVIYIVWGVMEITSIPIGK